MPPQTVQFEGKSYKFPDDAKDEEILDFLHTTNYKSPTGVSSPIAPPALKRPDAGVHESYLMGDPNKDPANALQDDLGTLGHSALNTLKSAGRVSGPNVLYQSARQASPYLRKKLPEGLGQTSPEEVMGWGAGLAEGVPEGESAALEETAAGRRSPTSPVAATGAAGFSSTRPEVEGGNIVPPSAASKLVSKIPGKQSIIQDVADLVAPTASKRFTSIKNILQRFIPKEETGGEVTESAPASIGTSTIRPGGAVTSPETSFTSPVGGEARTSTILQKANPPSNRPAPAWRQVPATDASPEVTPEAAPVNPRNQMSRRMRTIDTLQDRDIQDQMRQSLSGPASKLKKMPAHSITEDLEPEGPRRTGTGPGAMLASDSSAMETIDKDLERRGMRTPGAPQLRRKGERLNDIRDDQGVKQEIETKLRRKHSVPWGSVQRELH